MFYYIAEKIDSTDDQDLKSGARVFIFNKKFNYFLSGFEGPFYSEAELKKQSKIAKDLFNKDPARYRKIFVDKNIIKPRNHFITKQPELFSKKFLLSFQHILSGEVKKNVFKGAHFFDKSTMSINKVITYNHFTEVLYADLNIYNLRSKTSHNKVSSLFPLNWDRTRLLEEILSALKTAIKLSNSKYISITKSGVPVVIILSGNNIKTIYPAIKKP